MVDISANKIKFVKFDRIFLEKSYEWVTTEPVKTLIDAQYITKEQQIEWYNKLEGRTDYFIEGIKYKLQPIGVWGLKKITTENAEYFGYIGEVEFWGKGIGNLLLKRAIEKAHQFRLKTLYLHVVKFNERAIRLYHRFDFQECPEKSNEKSLYMELKTE